MRLSDAVLSVTKAAENLERCFLSTPNLNFLISCRHDAPFRDSVLRSDLSVADGMPLYWISIVLGIPLPERVSGSGMFEALVAEKDSQMKVYFFGGFDGVAESACREVNANLGGMRCVGYDSPGFGSVEDMSSAAVIDRINISCADFLIVALGARKGNAWIEFNIPRLDVPVVSHLGAVVNFAAGSLKRAPTWVQQVGCEWLWRIKEEPRLWQRYLLDGVQFLRLLLTRVLPYMVFLRCNRNARIVEANIEVNQDQHSGLRGLILRGSWTIANLEPLQDAFRSAANDEVDIRLDFRDVIYVDSAFIGLLMLLYGHQQAAGKRLLSVHVGKPLQRIFKWSCAEYLLSE